jgi:hypothetical protein
MKTVLTTLSNKLYIESRLRLNDSALKYGFDEVASYDFDDLKGTAFFEENKKLLLNPRGLGYWIWKPYILSETLKKVSEGDIVVYCDAGIEIIRNVAPLFEICETQPILLFANGTLKNRVWTKRDAFILMKADSRKYRNGLQCDASFSVFKKCEQSILFLKDWLHFCCDERVVTEMPNVCGKKNFFGYKEHRYDQSILSLLAIKYNVPLHRMPSQFGNHYKMPEFRVPGEFNCVNQTRQRQVKYYSKKPYYNSPYFQLLDHHRTKINSENLDKKKIPVLKAIFISGKRRWGKIMRFITRT